jgi:hypothetical protein
VLLMRTIQTVSMLAILIGAEALTQPVSAAKAERGGVVVHHGALVWSGWEPLLHQGRCAVRFWGSVLQGWRHKSRTVQVRSRCGLAGTGGDSGRIMSRFSRHNPCRSHTRRL